MIQTMHRRKILMTNCPARPKWKHHHHHHRRWRPRPCPRKVQKRRASFVVGPADDLAFLRTGTIHLSGTDQAGRTIWFYLPGLCAFKSLWNELRSRFYVAMELLKSEQAQREVLCLSRMPLVSCVIVWMVLASLCLAVAPRCFAQLRGQSQGIYPGECSSCSDPSERPIQNPDASWKSSGDTVYPVNVWDIVEATTIVLQDQPISIWWSLALVQWMSCTRYWQTTEKQGSCPTKKYRILWQSSCLQ